MTEINLSHLPYEITLGLEAEYQSKINQGDEKMNNLEEIKKRLAYAENNNLFDAHYINDMKYLIDINRLDQKNVEKLTKEREEDASQIKAHLTTCSALMKMIDLKDQAIINASVELVKYMKFTFDPDEVEYKKLKVLIEELVSIPGMELPKEETLFTQAQKISDHLRHLSTE